MIKVIYWGFVALDIMGLLFFFVLGLAAAGSSKTNPAAVAFYMLVLPGIPLLLSMVMFMRSSSPLWRGLAFVVAAAPLVYIASTQLFARAQFAANSNAAGDLTFFRAGPMRELVEAIKRNDAAAVAAIAPKVDVNQSGLADMTPLVAALRQLGETPDQQEVLKALIKAGADPNKGTKYEIPLEMAMQVSAKAGLAPVKLLLDAGANPNQKDSFGTPVYFGASGRGAHVDELALVLDHGADLKATDSKGATALIYAATTPNWKAALLLLQRGADRTQGRSFDGLTFEQVAEKYAREKKDGLMPWVKADEDDGIDAVMAFLRQPERK